MRPAATRHGKSAVGLVHWTAVVRCSASVTDQQRQRDLDLQERPCMPGIDA